MYRVFCESMKNYLMDFDCNDIRYKLAEPMILLADEKKYKQEKINQTDIYKQTSQFLYFAEKNINKYPKFKAFLWTLESRDMIGKKYKVSDKETLNEQAKILNMILNLVYWH